LKRFLSVFLIHTADAHECGCRSRLRHGAYQLLAAFAPVVLLARGFPLSRCRADSCGIGLASGNAG
jgi:hypothetical protein